MKPTDQLKEEHGGVKVMLGIIGKVCDRMGAGQAIPVRHLEQILEFLKVFVDTCHHAKEEQCLFPAMEAVGVPREGGPIGQMLHEHEQGRGFVRAMGAAARGYAGNDAGSAEAFVAASRGYAELLFAHIDKEDNVLYPIADARLSPETQAALLVDFERIEEERVGQGRHEAFHKMLHALAEEYGAM
ncbi:MAG TPA: hemerythrin domain-containing protein [Candidatus Deferrimicrobiaceae bacterium]